LNLCEIKRRKAELVLHDHGEWSNPFRSGLRILRAPVTLHWGQFWNCASRPPPASPIYRRPNRTSRTRLATRIIGIRGLMVSNDSPGRPRLLVLLAILLVSCSHPSPTAPQQPAAVSQFSTN